jgi:exodeoxyribonuclease I
LPASTLPASTLPASFYWHDYETWGSSPGLDRPCQFAGLRTDADLNEVGAPLVVFARPADDLLPQPDACLVTGITPQRAEREGVPEAEFARAIREQLAAPGTCGVGYNSLRFDDEVTRYLLYRNLLPPYAHTYENGNSRWDLINVLRLAHALRPDGIAWPEREPGVTSFRLEHLTAANGIPHAEAHDALADVRATIALARLLKRAQPKLFQYALTLRSRQTVENLIDRGEPLLHVSQRFPAAQGCIAPVAIVGTAEDNPKQRWCFDLRADPAVLLDLPAEDIRARVFVASQDLPEGVERIPLKGLKTNAVPMLAPLKTLTPTATERWSIDPARVVERAAFVRHHGAAIAAKVRDVHRREPEAGGAPPDPERMLYGGGFFTDADIRTMARLHGLTPQALAAEQPRFQDARLPTLLFRMRARNWPDTLTEAEREDWDAWRFERLTDPERGASLTVDAFEARLTELAAEHAGDPERLRLLTALGAWGERVMDAGL